MRVSISGQIVSNDDKWLYDYFEIPCSCPADIREAIDATPEGDTLTVAINSGGGDVFAGFEMYTLLRQAACPTVAEVESLAASAASTAMIGCDTVLLSPVAQVMIHMPSCETYGNADDHRESIEVLESILVSIINGYELKCRGKASRDQLEQLVRASTWMPVQDAVALGLADGVLGEEDGLTMTSRIVNAARGFSGLQMPSKAALLAEYRHRVENGAAPAQGRETTPVSDSTPPTGESAETSVDDNWLDEAFVFIEQERFKFL